MGLRDQLLKAGLVSKKQAQKTAADAKRLEYSAQKNKVLASTLAAEREADQQTIEFEKAAKIEADRALNIARDTCRLEREKLLRCTQLLESNRLNEAKASVAYHFSENLRHVRRVMVSPFQREMLARGKYGIARISSEVDEFFIVSKHTALTVQSLCPEKLILLHSEIEDLAEVEAGE